MSNCRAVSSDVTYCKDPYEAARGAEAILIVTEWDEFRTVDWNRLANLVEHRVVLDGRNMFNPQEITSRGFRYVSIGRQPVGQHVEASGAQREFSVRVETFEQGIPV
jgi:hypothetical protein